MRGLGFVHVFWLYVSVYMVIVARSWYIARLSVFVQFVQEDSVARSSCARAPALSGATYRSVYTPIFPTISNEHFILAFTRSLSYNYRVGHSSSMIQTRSNFHGKRPQQGPRGPPRQ